MIRFAAEIYDHDPAEWIAHYENRNKNKSGNSEKNNENNNNNNNR